jgi:hypothetical protein
LRVCVHERGAQRADAEGKTRCWDKPSRSDLLAQNVARNFEDDVAHVLGSKVSEVKEVVVRSDTHENAEHGVVVVTCQSEVFLEAGQSCVACNIVSQVIEIGHSIAVTHLCSRGL